MIGVSSTVVLLPINLLSLSLQHNYNIMCGLYFKINAACLPLHPVQLGVEETGAAVSQLAGHEIKVTSAEKIGARPPPSGE